MLRVENRRNSFDELILFLRVVLHDVETRDIEKEDGVLGLEKEELLEELHG